LEAYGPVGHEVTEDWRHCLRRRFNIGFLRPISLDGQFEEREIERTRSRVEENKHAYRLLLQRAGRK
jgi:hypothetical protein